ncbi:hypothetical protein BDW02DRAFT_546935 [Decorospora gaudefroyi]|uniref:P-loop containing nucleoside triphosphate hydrolase protein n=1 Tax=Decorospora gaudefroyi TaxID=184978 RepID=A0A6A5KD68_9PLEO|nr:hypothetical protein BDW02DRAFT_546935 [Decorospora gaudefroyi]
MDSPMALDDEATATVAPTHGFQLRSYQAEMVEASMKDNIIVAMDTGSGKTHIAIERTRAELEMCQPDKLVWFLAPTVTLCEQQHEVFQSNLPGFGHQLLCGRDNIELWTKQSDWDAVLHNVRIVLSTHQVLLDALTHGFIRMGKLALLIFDEAHHCTLKHPAHRIMSDFYMPQVESGNSEVPKVLGLSASPVMKAAATTAALEQIEKNLRATTKTPKLHRSDLMRYVHKPELLQINYPSETLNNERSQLLLALQHAYETYDLMTDPYVTSLLDQQRKGYDTSRQLSKLWLNHKTYCYDQLKSLVSKAKAMAEELGISAMEYYLQQCMIQFEKMARISDQQLLDLSTNERRHLLNILKGLPFRDFSPDPCSILDSVSEKVNILVETLVAEASGNPNFTGLVFVQQRVWVAALAEILSCHPRTRNLLRIGTFVGTSNSTKRKTDIASFAEPKNQQNTLEDFRGGALNLILATSVLEEGIDISSCHLVVCFERPTNLKSFVQRRGRARKQHSRFFIFTPDGGPSRSSHSWQALEAEMRKAYEDDMRQAKLAEEREQCDEDGERYFRVQSTGALLTLGNACSHLFHFCDRSGSGTYVNTQPQLDFTDTRGGITAEVMLPLSVDPTVRSARSLESWKTEKMAQKDAAFEAYKALYVSGLVNDNLLPVGEEGDNEAAQNQIPDHRPSLVLVLPTFDPWPMIAQTHQEQPHRWYRTMLEVRTPREEPMRMILLSPAAMPKIPEVLLHWNKTTGYTVESSWLPVASMADDEIQLLRSITWKILRSVFGVHIKENVDDFLCLLAPCDPTGCVMNDTQLRAWHARTDGQLLASELLVRGRLDLASWGLLTPQGDARRFIPKAIIPSQSQEFQGVEETLLQATRLPKRRDFLHAVYNDAGVKEAYTRVEGFPASGCIVDNLPASYSIFALLYPSILSKIQVYMVTDMLRSTHLKPVALDAQHLPIIVTALTSSAADAHNNYQNLEFLGDCILKFIASVHLMAANPLMPEGILTGKKGRLVSNGYLARATLAAGLDKFIFHKGFTGAKWRPRYVSVEVLSANSSPAKQKKSSKLVADIIESLIGASYVVGGFTKAFACVQALLRLEQWTPIPEANDLLYDAAPAQDTVSGLTLLEELLGHTFTKKSLLLEALTHPSFRGVNTHCSYERLEFLGDAVLDYIISKRLYAHEPPLPHRKMHSIRTAMVNAYFLTYTMFETTVAEPLTNKTTLQLEPHHRALWQFLRSTNYHLIASRDTARTQHAAARTHIAEALAHDARFPWHLLMRTDPPKFLSDIVESVVGALYIDSRGCIAVCEEFVARLGILSQLEHILDRGVDCLHPKERLGILAVDQRVQYVKVEEEGEGEGGYKCQVRVGGVDVGGVVEGCRKLNAETIAAWEAVRVLERGGGGGGDVDGDETGSEEDVFFDKEEGGGVVLDD